MSRCDYLCLKECNWPVPQDDIKNESIGILKFYETVSCMCKIWWAWTQWRQEFNLFHQLCLCLRSCKFQANLLLHHIFPRFPCIFLILSFIVVLYHVTSASQPRYWTGSVGVELGVRTAICWWDKSASRARDRWRHSGQATKKIAPRRQKTVRTPPIIQPCGNFMDMKRVYKNYPLVLNMLEHCPQMWTEHMFNTS